MCVCVCVCVRACVCVCVCVTCLSDLKGSVSWYRLTINTNPLCAPAYSLQLGFPAYLPSSLSLPPQCICCWPVAQHLHATRATVLCHILPLYVCLQHWTCTCTCRWWGMEGGRACGNTFLAKRHPPLESCPLCGREVVGINIAEINFQPPLIVIGRGTAPVYETLHLWWCSEN